MLFSDSQRRFTAELAGIAYTNPFDVETVRSFEIAASEIEIGLSVEQGAVDRNPIPDRPRLPGLLEKAQTLLEHLVPRVPDELQPAEHELYEDLCLMVLYFRFRDRFQETLKGAAENVTQDGMPAKYYPEYAREFERILRPAGTELEPAHLFACHFQIRRAYDLIHSQLVGDSPAIERLRASIWFSVFTHDMRRYRVSLFNRMHEISTLITGESGTGKELVARAIGLSRYVPFDPSTGRFTESVPGAFHAVNLAALSPQLIESELFGHSKGSFTGALKDRAGWLEQCRESHSVFLDEIGELDPTLQVKLLRVLQNRTYERIGETQTRRFAGKVISATNRDLATEIHTGRFRADVYYRLCSDLIPTPALRDQIQNQPEELLNLVRFLARRICHEDPSQLAEDVVHWITHHLPADYSWPGNFRELEQCVRNILVRKEYRPLPSVEQTQANSLLSRLRKLNLSVTEFSRLYATLIYQRTGSFVASGKILGVDRRTVKEWLLSEDELQTLDQSLDEPAD